MTWLLALALQDTREVIASDRPVEIRVSVSSESVHRATVVRFPEDSLEALVAGWNEGDLSIERRRENLFIKLLRKAQGDIHVLGASGTLYRLRIVPAEEAYDGQVRLMLPKDARREVPESIDLIRAMRLGRRPAQGSVLRTDQSIHVSDGWDAKVLYVYESSTYRGFVVRVESLSAGPQRLDPSRFMARDLVLVALFERWVQAWALVAKLVLWVLALGG